VQVLIVFLMTIAVKNLPVGTAYAMWRIKVAGQIAQRPID
jgi:multidrug transporter EmrE-like cation transporter